ncbi:MAG: tetratricopeptide repeat protein [Gemmatimonadetes bacterium]|nr:tetratricopeptide repeat protein [Gemmatimonadota bacterium]
MKALLSAERTSRAACALAVLGVAVLPLVARAQRRAPQPPRFMITPFRAPEKALGCLAADAVRERLADDNPQRILFIIPKDDINRTLEASGFPPCDPLPATEAKSLASVVRADEYLDGVVTKTPTGFKLEARLFLGRDNSYSQPMPAVEGARLGDVAARLSRQLDDVRKQIEDEKSCYTNTRLRNEKEAIKNARDAIRQYPRATLARVCLLQAMDQSKANKDSMFAVAQEILILDSISRPALTLTSSYYKERGDSTRYVETLTRLFANDPTNPRLADRVVTDLVLYKRMPTAIPIIKRALAENPGETQLLATAFKLYYAASEYKEMIGVGEEIVRIDTAFADSSYFFRMAFAYAADSQPARQAEMFARGAQKFPASTSWLLLLAQVQRAQGQNQQAMETLKKALVADPKTKGVYLQLARSYQEQKQPDSALMMVRHGIEAKDSVPLLSQYALSIANARYREGNASKNRDDWSASIKIAQYADSVTPDPRAKLLIGASALSIAISALQEASTARSCDLARLSVDNFTLVNVVVPGAGAANREQAGQLMQNAMQYGPMADNLVKQLKCK